MEEMAQKAIDQVHSVNMKLLIEMDRLCRENNIEYFIDSGTLLGAVRHKGFIPWDDDVDVVLKRSEFNKLLAAGDKLSAGFRLVRPENSEYFFDNTTRIVYENSLLHTPSDEDKQFNNDQNHIALDLFPLDNLGGGISGKLQILMIKIIYGMELSLRYKIDYSKYSVIDKIKVMILRTMGRPFSLKKLIRMFNKNATKYNNKHSEYYVSAYYPIPDISKPIKTEWYEKSCVQYINQVPFPAPAGYRGLLTSLYGDYNQLPPEDKRQPIHINPEELRVW